MMCGLGTVTLLGTAVNEVFVPDYHVKKHAVHLMAHDTHPWTVIALSVMINRSRCRLFKKASFPRGQKVKSRHDRRDCGLRRGKKAPAICHLHDLPVSHIFRKDHLCRADNRNHVIPILKVIVLHRWQTLPCWRKVFSMARTPPLEWPP